MISIVIILCIISWLYCGTLNFNYFSYVDGGFVSNKEWLKALLVYHIGGPILSIMVLCMVGGNVLAFIGEKISSWLDK